MDSLNYFNLKVQRKLSQVFNIEIFTKIYKGDLKGYKFLANNPDSYFINEYENNNFSYVLNELNNNPGSIIYDLGANIGYFSMLCSATSPQSKIFCFEPIPVNMAVLCRHLLINRIKNVFPVNFAISDHFGLVDFSADNLSHSYTYKQSSAHYGNRQINIKVGIISMDILINDFEFAKPDILKIDVEGAEYDVLAGAVNVIKNYKPKILLSTHEAHVTGVEEKCLAFLDDVNYSYTKIENDIDRPVGLNDFWCIAK
ncbi:MAG TPA: FkbM family methyltransferase [Chitinophagaceae bacterium]|nr:FkbM family methyltransferase [Chitinophagaceae bacterium]